MIQINIETNNTVLEQFDKVTEEYEEVLEAIKDSEKHEYQFSHLNDHIIAECFDLIQATNQIIRLLTDEKGYMQKYKKHLTKLQDRAWQGNIKIKECLEM